MTEQRLDGPDVRPILEQVRREGMAEGVPAGRLGEAGIANGLFHGALQHGLVEVMPATLAALAVEIGTRRGEDPLPAELAPGLRVLARERQGQLDPSGASMQVGRMLPLRTTIWLAPKSTSFTRSRAHSSRRRPAP